MAARQPLNQEAKEQLLKAADMNASHAGMSMMAATALRESARTNDDQTAADRLLDAECPHGDRIVREASLLLSDSFAYHSMARRINPYGDGQAARRIVEGVLHHFGRLQQRPDEFAPATPQGTWR